MNNPDINPIDIVEKIISETGWNYKRRTETVLSFERWGKWNRYDFAVAVRANGNNLGFFAEFDIVMPGKRKRVPQRFYELLNLVNQNTFMGAYTYMPTNNVIAWTYSMLLSSLGDYDYELVEELIEQALAEIDAHYPAFQLVIATAVTAQQAYDSAIPETYGRA